MLQPVPAAWGADLFTVSGVSVDAEAETASAARTIALADGQKRAFQALLRRLTLRADYPRHPELGGNRIAALVKGFGIAEEKTSSVRYLAKMTVEFKKEEVRNLLKDAGIPFSETPSKPLLVLPVYEKAGATLLWDEPNPWLAAWAEAHGESNPILPIRAPLGDLEDIRTISAEQALAGDEARIAAIANRYGVSETLVVHAEHIRDFAGGGLRLDVAMHRFGGVGMATIVDSFTSGGDEAELMRAGVEGVRLRMEEEWKRSNLLRFGEEFVISANVPLKGLAYWMEVQKKLAQAAVVRKVEVASLTVDDAQILLHFLGGADQLALALDQLDMSLVQEEGYWTLRLGKGGQ